MTDMTMNNNGNRKKYLVPLVILLLCGVALTGAAYAYSSSVTETGQIDEDFVAIKMYKNIHDEQAKTDTKGDFASNIVGLELNWHSSTVGANTTWYLDESKVYYWLAIDSTMSSVSKIELEDISVALYTDSACDDAHLYRGVAQVEIVEESALEGKDVTVAGSMFTIRLHADDGTEKPGAAKETLWVKVVATTVDADVKQA